MRGERSAAAGKTPQDGSAVSVRVRVNGEERSVALGSSISALLAQLKISTPRVAVERNREIVPRARYDSTHLENGDEIEVVEFVGGG